ncbi:MAG: sulfurtransferase [Actinomycetota bacterium]|nr:sulfurtransferase [Actinomycetota bacterium]
MDVLIQAAELKALMTSSERVVILDVRWKLGGPPGHDEYLTGHLPGAVFVDLPGELAGRGEARDGRHPLPSVSDLQEAARRWGVCVGDPVVAYDANGNLAAARLWWLLRWGGFENVRLLDGGLSAWIDAGGSLDTDGVKPEPGDVELTCGALGVVTIDEIPAFAASALLLDARASERYRGEVEPIDPVAGHIPGAVSASTELNLDSAGRFLGAEELRARFEALGVSRSTGVGVYCGSGVTAAHEIAALAIAGFDAALYPGSWSQWSNHPDLPVARGAQPGK